VPPFPLVVVPGWLGAFAEHGLGSEPKESGGLIGNGCARRRWVRGIFSVRLERLWLEARQQNLARRDGRKHEQAWLSMIEGCVHGLALVNFGSAPFEAADDHLGRLIVKSNPANHRSKPAGQGAGSSSLPAGLFYRSREYAETPCCSSGLLGSGQPLNGAFPRRTVFGGLVLLLLLPNESLKGQNCPSWGYNFRHQRKHVAVACCR